MKVKKSKIVAKRVKKKQQLKKPLSKVTTEEFFEQNFEDSSGEDEERKSGSNSEDKDYDSGESDMDPDEHKKSLMKLKDTDPEFYSYLKENDKKLLEFNLSDEDDVPSEIEDSKTHTLEDNLEIASDESDYEPVGEEGSTTLGGPQKVTQKLLQTWQDELEKTRPLKTIKNVVEAFHAALQMVEEPNEPKSTRYKVEGATAFNGIVRLCILHLPPAFKKFLQLGPGNSFEAHKAKRFVKVKTVIKSYLTDLIKILKNVTSSNILTVLLKHLHQMLPYVHSFSTLSKPLLRILLQMWSSGEDTVRVVAFLNILHYALGRKGSILETLLKTMYVKYVENSKFVSPITLPGINFMRHSLCEIFMLDCNLSYNHAFLYIRQLAIHLRNAVTLKKKEYFQAVYNWQYINSLRFWAELIRLKNQSMLQSLLYPLVQIITGTIKVIPTTQYYPLRFHCIEILINISKDTDTFIPILPFALEILDSYDFNKRHKAVSMKPIPLTCVLRMSKAQLQENGFKDSIIENIYELVLTCAEKDSHKIYFPDMYVPCVIQLKAFVKKCHVANYCRKIKQLLDKIEENRQFIEKQRANVAFELKDTVEIKNWENRMRAQGTPISKFFESWIKIQRSQKLKLLTKNDEVADFGLPTLKKLKERARETEENGDDDEDELEVLEKRKRKSKSGRRAEKKKTKHAALEDIEDLPRENTDIVKETSVNDWD
ncbi:nucleolar complex protein 2 homolog isoform X2 [Orussus abietinus]|uniref:nucleolar complex protein 2 homolog isoform X2 n=1 Tax=Orussus abietinus TaxID=222816 RepID=UPI000626C504|nr:nucleolar complex protein 2 homolog isoform X2 [Orussus abietinus]